MSATILHFTPRAELGSHANLQAFIELCKASKVMNAVCQFGLNSWELEHLKGQNKANRAIFSTLEASKTSSSEPAFPQPFLDFAKAALVYLQDKRPVASQGVRISAFRFLEAALREWNRDSRPTAVDVDVLDTALELAKAQVSPGVAYRVAGQLEIIADLMTSKGFISLRQPWGHGLKKPTELGSRISKESLEARQEKLPSAATLRALAGIFHEAVDVPDIMVSSYTALMLCAPERINEVLRLVRNCLVEGDGRFIGKLGLRWAGSKGADDTTKWLPSEMAPVAREAIANLQKISAPAQALAEWYTENPKRLFVHAGAEHLRGKALLTSAELATLLWGDPDKRVAANEWATKKAKLEKISMVGQRIGYKFADVEKAVVAMLPDTFPYVPGAPELLCKDAMSLMRVNEAHRERATYLCMFDCIDNGIITNALGREDRKSIFARFNYTEDDGSPIYLHSHSLRHYLNMLAHVGGLSSAEIAIFSGRKDVTQNWAYDHMSAEEVQAPISQALKAGFTGNLVTTTGRDLVMRSEFKGIGILAAHTTEYGWCRHNFASEPCQMYRDCLNCEEQECIKGDAQREANLRKMKGETEYLLKTARESLSAEEYGADTWVAHQSRTLERVNTLLSIFEDPSVPDGAHIRLNLENAALITNREDAPKVITIHRRSRLK